MNLDDLVLFKAPFPVESLSWRVGNKSNWDKVNKKPKDPNKPVKAQMLVYIDSRDVQDRLDEVCEICDILWENDFKEVGGRMVCNLTILEPVSGYRITRTDGAGDTDFEAEKGGLSDAFKRAAVMFGVGRYLYNAKNFNTWIEYGEKDTDITIAQKAKEQLRDVAISLGKPVQTYHYWLDIVDNCSPADFERIVELARMYAKRELWSTGNRETFKEHVEKRKKEFKDAENKSN